MLAEPFDRTFTVGAQAIGDVLFCPEPFIERAVPPRVRIAVNQSFIMQLLKIPLNDGLMPGIGGPDKGIVRNIQSRPQLLKLGSELVAVDLGGDSSLRRGLLHFLPVLIESGQKNYISSAEPPVSRQYVGGNRRIGMSDMGNVVDVVNRCRDVERLLIAHGRGPAVGSRPAEALT